MYSSDLEYLFLSIGVEPVYLLIALAVLAVLGIVFIILVIVMLCKQKKVYRAYDRFMRGKDAETLEDTLFACMKKTEDVDKKNQKLQEDIILLQKNQRITYQKMGMVKYNAFREMSGDLSYALVLLDQEENGFVINSVYAKEGGYSYIKEIVNGKCAILLSEEEQKALEKAKSQT